MQVLYAGNLQPQRLAFFDFFLKAKVNYSIIAVSLLFFLYMRKNLTKKIYFLISFYGSLMVIIHLVGLTSYAGLAWMRYISVIPSFLLVWILFLILRSYDDQKMKAMNGSDV